MAGFLRVKRVIIVIIFVGIEVVLSSANGWRDGNIKMVHGILLLLIISISKESNLICVDCICVGLLLGSTYWFGGSHFFDRDIYVNYEFCG